MRKPRFAASTIPAALVLTLAAGYHPVTNVAGDLKLAAATNNHPGFIAAYSANVENLVGYAAIPAQCERNWGGLVNYMTHRGYYKPDIVVVQQVSNASNLDKLINRMETKLGVDYAGVLAVASPRPTGGGNCATPNGPREMESDQKKYQTNAIIYRTARLSPKGSKRTWQSNAVVEKNGTLVNGGACVNVAKHDPSQDRAINVAVRFDDNVSGKNVTVASFHWPTRRSNSAGTLITNPHGESDKLKCAAANINELVDETSGPVMGTAALNVYGGDANVTDRAAGATTTWYQRLSSHGVRDTVATTCSESSTATRTCLEQNWTRTSGRRIDYLFGRLSSKVSGGRTIRWSWNAADTNAADRDMDPYTSRYSDHRGVYSLLYY